MSRKLLATGLFSLPLTVTLLFAYGRPLPMSRSFDHAKQSVANDSPFGAAEAEALWQTPRYIDEDVAESRNLEMQPEALKLSRRLGGQRFKARATHGLVLTGVLTTNDEIQVIRIARRQNAKGERVEIAFEGKPGSFAWDETSGSLSSRGTLTLSERTLLERLTCDSADQFILAQLRGASYYVVAHNVRPNDVADDYSGPLWDVVRIDDPEQDEQKRPLSRWRLYYLNSITGLIDQIVSEIQGKRIEANFSGWTEQASEKFPSTITWTSQGQRLMTFTLTNVSFAAQ